MSREYRLLVNRVLVARPGSRKGRPFFSHRPKIPQAGSASITRDCDLNRAGNRCDLTPVQFFLHVGGRLVRYVVLLCLALLSACAKDIPTFTGAESPLLYDPAQVADADRIAILIPGALASVGIFAPADRWRDDGYALVYYRYPGLDGLPLDHALGIENAARQIAEFASRYPDKPIRLLGYSTGAPIAIRAAEQIDGDVRVAAMSPAVERGGGITTALRGGTDAVAAIIATGSFDRAKIWRQYYRTLLFGRKGLRDPEKVALADAIIGPDDDNVTPPPAEMPRAHTGDLSRWSLDDAPRLPAHRLRFFIGLEDSLFSTNQTRRFARNFGDVLILGYPEHGHLLFETRPDVFDDVRAFFDD
jgi:pimeloyl-ACP methyl ester carboxylesterase